MERRLRKLESGNDRYPYYPQEENRYIDPTLSPLPDVEYGRKMPQIGFSQSGTGTSGLDSMSMAVRTAAPSRCHASTSPTMKRKNGATAW